MTRPDLLALAPESVAALANLGLVKRAQREIATGQGPKLEEDASGVVIGRFDSDVETRVPPGVPLRDASCSCGAKTVCRHRVAVVLAYPAWHALQESTKAKASDRAVEQSWSPSCFTDDSLAKLVGKRLFARATAMVRTGVVVELEGGAIPTAKLPTCAVRFHVPCDLAYARCDCQAAVACEHVVVASWAFRRADDDGTTPPCTVELAAETTGTAPADAPLEEALRLAEYVVTDGVAHLGDADRVRFARVRAALQSANDLLWPSMIVDDLEIGIELYQARSARYRTGTLVHLVASLAARSRAAKNHGELPRRFVLGSDEARETALDHVRLVSLGATIDADGRSRDAEVYLADSDSGVVLVASKRFTFAEDAEPENGPDLARRAIAGRITLGTLAHGQLVTRAAKRQANHSVSISTTRTAKTSVAPSSGGWGSLPPSLLVNDFAVLASSLRERPPRMLRPRRLASQIRVLAIAPGQVLRVGYRPGEQEIVAELGDGNGGRVLLSKHHRSAAPHALDVLAQALDGPHAPRFVAGEVRLGPSGLEIDPTAIVTDRVLVPDLEGAVTSAASRVDALPHFAPRAAQPMQLALDATQALLEESLHDGLAHLRPGFADRASAAADALSKVGLLAMERRIRALRASVVTHAPAAAAWIDASVRLELTREASNVGT